ncbi:MAG TPA: hypothetical protein VKX17_21760 [Planctomycetota bacterium]|nr:hypothetical protein [Planctomycetota bacterium]
MPSPHLILAPESLALTALAAVFSGFILSNDPEKWHWRGYFWTVVAVNALFSVFGPWGFLFGVFGVLLAPYVYFRTFGKRQFSLRDLMLYVLLLASMCTQIASSVHR